MIDRSTTRTFDEVPEADLAEQSVPAYPDPGTESESFDREVADRVDRDAFTANEADVVEQSISVPLDDEDRDDPDAGVDDGGPAYTEEI
ncbi:hypothetical protein [Nocardia goodfellowii]|uniref:DUF5709 domain-containing protein n=1 Tax=Nocardia goodfellowii TaxID=882446 RepID=A0ABS4QCF5_9NOCA|nr:hypothetical protein [Nocardia goodfellowii]MBP2188825.1 hypothetical protein [Nocardia goodfellowii]